MKFHLDHVFVCVGEVSWADAAIASLSELGLDLSTTRVYPVLPLSIRW